MGYKGDVFWEEITINDLKKLYLIVLKKYKELDYEEWLQYIIVKEKSNRAWSLNVDSKIQFSNIYPSLLFIWYAYTHLDSTNTNAAHVVNEIQENTLKSNKKRYQKQRIRDEKQILKTLDKEIKIEERRIWGNLINVPKIKKRKRKVKETLEQKTKRLVLKRKKKEEKQQKKIAIEKEKKEKEERKRIAIAIEQWEKEKRKKMEDDENATRLAYKREYETSETAIQLALRLYDQKKSRENTLPEQRKKRFIHKEELNKKIPENETPVQRALRLYDQKKDEALQKRKKDLD